MKFKNLIRLLFFFLILSCKSYNKNKINYNEKNQAVEYAILDFVNTNKLAKKNSSFKVKIYNPLYKKILNKKSNSTSIWENEKPYEDYIVVNIFGNNYKFRNDEIPSKYYEINNKIFTWNDENKSADKKTIEILKKYKLITNGIIDTIKIIDDSKKGTDYYFCKNNIKKFKKVNTNIGTGYYEAPKLKCK